LTIMGSRSGTREPVAHRDAFVTGGAYGLLLILGAVEGLIGSFQYSAWTTGAIVPAVGWIVASFVLDSPSHQGSVIVAAVPSGEWYLYGGSVAALLAIVAAFALWVRRTSQKLPR
jgi:hypothetical protein